MNSSDRPAASSRLKNYASAISTSYADIFFWQSPRYGLLLLAISFVNFNVSLSGLLAVLTVLLFAAFIRMNTAFLENGFYIYNPLLVGMSIGFLFQLTAVSFLLIIMASIFTFLLTLVLADLFYKMSVPILSLPFTLVSTLIYLATLNYTALYSQVLYVQPKFLDLSMLPFDMYFKSLGTILFLPYVGTGLLFALLLLCYSRLMFVLSIFGFYTGVYMHSLMLGSWEPALSNPYAFNYILIAIALGSVFLVPSLRSLIIALLGVAMSVFLIDASSSFWTIYKIPVFALPFNVIVIIFVFVLKKLKLKEFAYNIRKTPESTLRSSVLSHFRFKQGDINLFLPFSGKWSVYQAFNGEWTHQGKWRYAYDFVILKEGRSYRGEGNSLEDFYAYKQPVCSPLPGYVVDVKDDIEDNPVGRVNTRDNWGNYVIIQSHFGYFIELSHFAQGSLKVKKGDYVQPAEILGLCGNSGYSPQPHIHIQVQDQAALGGRTLPFRFVSYLEEKHIHFYQNLAKGTEIESYTADKEMEAKLNFSLGKVYVYTVYQGKKSIDTLRIEVKIEHFSGKHYFEDDRKNRLYFAKEANMFFLYDYEGKKRSWLQKFYVAIGRIPLVYRKDYTWNDYIPLSYISENILVRLSATALALFVPKDYVSKGEWHFVDASHIEGFFLDKPEYRVRTELDPLGGIRRIEYGNYTLGLKDE